MHFSSNASKQPATNSKYKQSSVSRTQLPTAPSYSCLPRLSTSLNLIHELSFFSASLTISVEFHPNDSHPLPLVHALESQASAVFGQQMSAAGCLSCSWIYLHTVAETITGVHYAKSHGSVQVVGVGFTRERQLH